MNFVRRRRRIRASLLAATGLLVTGCGAGSTASDGSGDVARPASIEVAVPDLSVHDLQAGNEAPLRSFLGGEQPILFWFWAPH